MSIIAIKGVPYQWKIVQVMAVLAGEIKGQFEGLHFQLVKGSKQKICYLRLSEKLDPLQIIEKINKKGTFGKVTLQAYISDEVPDLPMAGKKLPIKACMESRIPTEVKPEEVLLVTHKEILIEMQCKYTGLYNLSKRIGHKLMLEVARSVYERLKNIMETNPGASATSFALSKAYRKSHPHFGDFQFILATLHKLQDAAGTARQQISENELCKVNVHPYAIENVPLNLVQSACNKYSQRIVKKMTDHIKGLKCNINPLTDSEEERARKKVRMELKKLSPYLPWIVKQVLSKHLVPEKAPFHRVKIYGEPLLPTKEQLAPLMKRFGAVRVNRCQRIFNLLRFNIAPAKYDMVMKEDGSVLHGAKLIIRSSDIPIWEVPRHLREEMRAALGAESGGDDEDEMDVDEDEEYDEEYVE